MGDGVTACQACRKHLNPVSHSYLCVGFVFAGVSVCICVVYCMCAVYCMSACVCACVPSVDPCFACHVSLCVLYVLCTYVHVWRCSALVYISVPVLCTCVHRVYLDSSQEQRGTQLVLMRPTVVLSGDMYVTLDKKVLRLASTNQGMDVAPGMVKRWLGRTWTDLGEHKAAVKSRATHPLCPLVEVPHLVSPIWSGPETCFAAVGRPKCR